MGIVRFALKFPHTFYVVAALVMFLGSVAIGTMPTDIFPEINIPVVTIVWQYTGLSTPEMEQRVTTYGQYALSSSVNGIQDIEAQTLNGISVQKIFFQPDVNLDLAIAQIVSATNFIRVLMPPGIQAPVVVQTTRPVFPCCRSDCPPTRSTSSSSTTTASIVCASSWHRSTASPSRPRPAASTGRSWSISTRSNCRQKA
jgi:multidrug efflux pump subunit AcrB